MSNVALGVIMVGIAALLYPPGESELSRRVNTALNAAIAAAMLVCGAVMILREVAR